MQTKQLGNSDMHITPIGIGAWAMGGGGWAFAWGPQDDDHSIAAIHAALDKGINWIDTAAVYGLGHSEEVVARALKGRSPKPFVFTKCERVWNARGEIGKSLKADSIRREVEASLRRLQLDVIDLYQIHWPEPEDEIEEGWTAMAQLQREGKVRWIGVSNFNVEQMRRAQAIAPITSLQPPYSMISPEIEESILPYAQANGIGVIVYSPMKSGLLSGAMTRERIAANAGRRFPPAHAAFPGAAPDAQPGVGRTAAVDRRAPRPHHRRSGHRLDAVASGGDGGDCGDAVGRTSGGRDRRDGIPAERGRGGGNRTFPARPRCIATHRLCVLIHNRSRA